MFLEPKNFENLYLVLLNFDNFFVQRNIEFPEHLAFN